MSVRNGLALFLALSALTFLAACGGSSPTPQPPPGGGFSPGSMNGTYVFSSSGFDVNAGFLTMVGSFVANGGGGITSGTVDIVSSDPAYGVFPNQSMSSASYIIGVDGRGQIKFIAPTAQGSVQFILDFVLTSSSHGLVAEFDNNGTGSGTIDLQPSPVSQTALNGLSYAFGISGVGSSASFATVGSMTLGATGSVTAGVEDFNNGGTPTTSDAISTSSFVTVGTGTGPGAAQLITGFGSGTYSYDVYAIDSTHMKFIETDGLFIALGDAYTQGTSIPAGTLVFTMSGSDTSGFPLAVAGFMPVSGGTIVGGAEDFNDNGFVDGTPAVFNGSFGPLSGGRSQLSVGAFVNGAANDLPGSYTFAAYPFSSNGVTGVQLLEIDGGVTAGTAYLQTGTAFAASQGYGFNLSAINLGNGTGAFEEDDIAEFQATSNGFSPGIVDINDEGSPNYRQSFSGSYSAVTTGEYSANTTEAGNPFVSFSFYAINGSTFLALELDQIQIGTGILELQNASGSPGAEPGISMVRSAAQAHVAARHTQK